MLIYIFKSAACMAIFFLFYKLLLEKENMHIFKRFYLLLAVGASLLIPALVFTEFVLVEPAPYVETQLPVLTDYDYIGVPAALEEDVLDIEPILWTIYFLGFTFFGVKFIKNLGQIIGRIRKNPKQRSASYIQVLLRENFPPHTFFKYIFLNKKKLESNEIPKAVLLHEETHAKQKHSWDVVFIELLQVIFWFNPLVYIFKKAIKLNHEFLADQAVLDKDIDKTTYQNTLLSYLSPDSHNKYQSKMANAINYSSIKKRFTVMKTHTSKKAMLLRSLLLLPLLAILLLGFSETKLIEVSTPTTSEITAKASLQELATYNELAKKYNSVAIEKRKIPLDDLKILETIFKRMSPEQKANSQPFPECLPKNIQDGASRELMKEYNSLAKKYNTMLLKSKSIRIKKKDVERLEYIHGLMSEKQRAAAEPFPDFPEPPAPPKAPKEAEEPKAPKVKKGEKSNIPPPPAPSEAPGVLNGRVNNIPQPPVPNHEEMEEVMELKEELEIREQEVLLQKEEAKLAQHEILMEQQEAKLEEIEAETERAYHVKRGMNNDITEPPAPPTPQSPLDHVIEMAKKGASFYYEDKEITSDKAIALLKKNKDLNIQSTGTSSKKPTVKISIQPIYLDKSAAPSAIETGNIEIDGNEGFYSKKNGVTSFFNSNGEQVDKTGKVLHSKSENNPKFYFNGKQISSEKAGRLLTSNRSIQVTRKEYSDGSYAVLLTDLNTYSGNNINTNNNLNSVIDLTEMIAKDATFFYNDRPIGTDKALWLTQNNLIKKVSTIRSIKGKPKVYFWDKS